MVKGSLRAAIIMALVVASAMVPTATMAAGAPPNDDWVSSTVITGVPFSASVDTTEATENGDSYHYCGGGSKTVWFRVELATTARVEISTAGSDYDTVIDAYQWFDPPGAFSPAGCDDNGGPRGTSRLVVELPAGQVFGIMISSPSGQSGGQLSFAISAVPPPANDDFDAATSVPQLPFSDSIDAGTATTAPDDPASTCGGQGPSVWYEFTPATSGRFQLTTEGSGYDTLLTVYTGSRGSLAEVICNDSYFPIGSYQARLRLDAAAGTTYHVAITWGAGQYPPAGVLHFGVAAAPPPPANDDFDSAIPIDLGNLPFAQDLDVSESKVAGDDPAPSCAGPLPSTVWYTLRPTTADRIALGVRGGDFGPTVALYRGDRGSLTELDCAAGSSEPGFVLDPVPGTTYHLLVGGATGDAGMLHVAAQLSFVVGLTLDRGKVDAKTGVVTLSGTLTCNKHSYISTSLGELSQKVGRNTVKGQFGIATECDGSMPWSATVQSDSGPFSGGKATVTLRIYGYASQTGENSQPLVSKSIVLVGAK